MVYDYIFLSSLAKSSELVLVQDQLMFQLSFIRHKPKKNYITHIPGSFLVDLKSSYKTSHLKPAQESRVFFKRAANLT
jgi:hypothetical protein